MPTRHIERVSRGRKLTPEEAAQYRQLRADIEREKPAINAEIRVQLAEQRELAAVFDEAVKQKAGGNRMVYELARALQNTEDEGNLVRAKELMEQLSESGVDDFWKKLARKALGKKDKAKEGGA